MNLPLRYETLRDPVDVVLGPVLRLHLRFQVLCILGQDCHPAGRFVIVGTNCLQNQTKRLFGAAFVCDTFLPLALNIRLCRAGGTNLFLPQRFNSGEKSTWGFLGGVVQGFLRWGLVSNRKPGSPQWECPWWVRKIKWAVQVKTGTEIGEPGKLFKRTISNSSDYWLRNRKVHVCIRLSNGPSDILHPIADSAQTTGNIWKDEEMK